METTFITVHDLTLDARVRYASDSIEDILGYLPHEVREKSCWEYFHPDEIPFARAIHGRGIELDKAAVLNYCRIKHKDGSWVSCECVFTVVYDVLVASTSIYKRSLRSQQRAAKAPAIRRIFSSSPRDPRYHMLSYISSKFTQSPKLDHEPRAALFINRFTRTSTIMFATNGVANIMGLEADQLVGKSFYFCIAQNCLQDAVRCLESAKANDSIAYLRFWFRNPLVQDRQADRENSMMSEEDEDEGGVNLHATEGRSPLNGVASDAGPPHIPGTGGDTEVREDNSRSSSDNSAHLNGQARDAIFDLPALPAQSSTSSTTPQDENAPGQEAIELEAVVSCTSDGLVVILRRAKAIPPTAESPAPLDYNSGFFASPWAPEPIVPTFARDVAPDAFGLPAARAARGPNDADFMNSIREVAVFAWSLTGINGSLSQFSRGRPSAEALPPDGFPVWDPNAPESDEKINGFSDNSHRRVIHDGADKDQMSTSSEDEVVYRRAPTIAPWRPVQRRARHEAFGAEGDEEGDARDRNANARRRRLDE